MQVSKKSWHYRYIKWFYHADIIGNIPKNLCRYFWKLVILLAVPVVPIVGITYLFVRFWPMSLWATIDVILLLAGTVAFIAAICGAMYLFEIRRLKRLERKHNIPKQSNFVVEYLKAKKAKVCPILEFVDE